MATGLQVWAVDVSEYELWTQADGGWGLIEEVLPVGDDDDEAAKAERQKVKRYVRESDQIRSLCGKLLARLAVCTTFPAAQWHALSFDTTAQGRPYLSSPRHAFDYNITHDGDWVAIVFASRPSLSLSPPSLSVLGIDVMEIHLPAFEASVYTFVETMDMTLTAREREWIAHDDTPHGMRNVDSAVLRQRGLSDDAYARLVRLYSIWTYKEAFTKARGLGLSFDFARIELADWERTREKDGLGNIVLRVLPASGSQKAAQGTRIEAVDDSSTHACVFRDTLLPPGRAHGVCSDSSPIKSRPGMGTGFASLLVVALPRTRVDERQAPQYNIHAKGDAADSGEGLRPRRWRMAELVHAARDMQSQHQLDR